MRTVDGPLAVTVASRGSSNRIHFVDGSGNRLNLCSSTIFSTGDTRWRRNGPIPTQKWPRPSRQWVRNVHRVLASSAVMYLLSAGAYGMKFSARAAARYRSSTANVGPAM